MKDTNPGSGVPVAIVGPNGVIRSIVYEEWVFLNISRLFPGVCRIIIDVIEINLK